MNKKYQLTCKEFGLRLAKIRESRSVSARQMSLDIGQNKNYINSIESGKNYPSMVHFFDICEYLHITPQAFFDTGNEQTFSVSTEDFCMLFPICHPRSTITFICWHAIFVKKILNEHSVVNIHQNGNSSSGLISHQKNNRSVSAL